jgi:Fur family ferric uptake transcriptional regulator
MGKRKKKQGAGLSTEQARQLLQDAGLRRTASRVAVLQELAAAGSPLSHAEVAQRLETTGFGAPTIFRCLSDLTEIGLIVRLDMGDHTWRFGFQGGHGQDADHPHFLCVDCGSAICLPGVDVNISPHRSRSIGDVTEVVLKGHCPNCR